MSKSSISAGLSALGAALGSSVRKSGKKKSKTIKKKASSKQSLLITPLSAGSNKQQSAPAGYGFPHDRRLGSMLPNFRVPFDVTVGVIATNASNACGFSNNAGTNVTNNMDINPLVTFAGGYVYPLGKVLNTVSSSFMRFKMHSLGLRYNPLVPTSTPGGIMFAYTADPYVNGTLNTLTLGTFRDNVPTAVWEPQQMKITALNKSTLFCFDTGAAQADDRFAAAGSILVFGIGLTASTTYGLASLSGEIEFLGLGDSVDLSMMKYSTKAAAISAVEKAFANVKDTPGAPERGFISVATDSSSSSSSSSSAVPTSLYEKYVKVVC